MSFPSKTNTDSQLLRKNCGPDLDFGSIDQHRETGDSFVLDKSSLVVDSKEWRIFVDLDFDSDLSSVGSWDPKEDSWTHDPDGPWPNHDSCVNCESFVFDLMRGDFCEPWQSYPKFLQTGKCSFCNHLPPRVLFVLDEPNKHKRNWKRKNGMEHFTYRIPDDEISTLEPKRRAKINGNNGSWTNSDDVSLWRLIFWIFESSDIWYKRRRHRKYPRPVFLPTFESQVHLFELCSSLNGNNGSCTNTDDHDNANRKRVKKEAKTAEHQKKKTLPVEGNEERNKVKKENKQNAFDRVHDIDRKPPAADEEPVYTSILKHVTQGDMYIDKDRWYVEAVYEVIKPCVMWCYSHGPGWVEVPTGPVDLKRARCVSVVSAEANYLVEGHYFENRLFPPKQWTLPRVLVETISQVLRPCDNSEAVLKSLSSRCHIMLKDLPDSIVTSVVDYFVSRVHCSLHRISGALLGGGFSTRNRYEVLRIDDDVELENSRDYTQPFMVRAKECPIDFDYRVKPGVRLNGKPLERKPTLRDLWPNAPRLDQEFSKWYDTILVSLQGIRKFNKYDNTPDNMRKALKRIIACREDEAIYVAEQEKLGYMLAAVMGMSDVFDACKFDPQEPDTSFSDESINVHANMCVHLKIWLGRCCPTALETYAAILNNIEDWSYNKLHELYLCTTDLFGSRTAAAEIKHVKEKLRKIFVRQTAHHEIDNIMTSKVQAKIKRELAKPAKAPRLFVDYGGNCMYANELPEFAKVCLQDPYIFENDDHTYVIRVFTKPRMKDIDDEFREAWDKLGVRNLHHIFIYSDDSVYMGNDEGRCYAYNVDISSCDSSNGSAIFYMVGVMLGGFDSDRAINLIRACNQPIRMIHPRSPGDVAVLNLRKPFEGSGTVLTTLLNHTASFCIALAFAYTHRDSVGERIIAGARFAGHEVTCEDTHLVREKLQFLKFSPLFLSDGKYHMVRNLGCIFRSFGRVDTDLLPEHIGCTAAEFRSLDWDVRAQRFLSGVVQSFKYEPQSSPMQMLREVYNVPVDNFPESRLVDVEGYDLSKLTVDDSSLNSRYDTSSSDFVILTRQISELSVGRVIVADALTNIYRVDYGL